jgi:hypothetical protein
LRTKAQRKTVNQNFSGRYKRIDEAEEEKEEELKVFRRLLYESVSADVVSVLLLFTPFSARLIFCIGFEAIHHPAKSDGIVVATRRTPTFQPPAK